MDRYQLIKNGKKVQLDDGLELTLKPLGIGTGFNEFMVISKALSSSSGDKTEIPLEELTQRIGREQGDALSIVILETLKKAPELKDTPLDDIERIAMVYFGDLLREVFELNFPVKFNEVPVEK